MKSIWPCTLFAIVFTCCLVNSSHAQAYEWVKPLHTSNGGGFPRDISVDGAGNVYITGLHESMTDFDPGSATSIAVNQGNYIAKYNSLGELIWVDTIIGINIHAHANDAANNIYIVGEISGTADFDPSAGVASYTNATGGPDIFIAKYKASGDYLWTRVLGNAHNNYAKDVVVKNNKVYVTGAFGGTVDFNAGPGIDTITSHGNLDIFFASYDLNGNLMMAKCIGSQFIDWGVGISVAPNSCDIIITGYVMGNLDLDPGPGTTVGICYTGVSNGFFSRYDSTGQFKDGYVYYSSSATPGETVAIDQSENFYISGFFQGPVDFDADTSSYLLFPVGSSAFVAKYSQSGNLLWVNELSAPFMQCSINASAVDTSGNLYLTGQFDTNIDFDPGPGTHTVNTEGVLDGFFACYTPSGSLVWAENLGSNSYDLMTDIAVDKHKNIYVTGYFSNTCDFDPFAGTAMITPLSPPGNFNIYFGKYHECDTTTSECNPETGIEEKENNTGFIISPNPSNGNFTLYAQTFLQNATLYIYDMKGSVVHTAPLASGNSANLNLGKGMYVVEIISGNLVMREKLVIY